MTKFLGFTMAVALAITAWGGAASTSKDEAPALVQRAVELVKTVGKEKAFQAFNDTTGPFVKGELYIFVVDYNGDTLSHGGNSKLIGKNMKGLKDADGKAFIQAMIEESKKGGGWVDYKWTNPTTKKIQEKTSYVLPLPGLNAFAGCGIYK